MFNGNNKGNRNYYPNNSYNPNNKNLKGNFRNFPRGDNSNQLKGVMNLFNNNGLNVSEKKMIIIQIIIQIKTLEVFLNQTKIIIVFLQMLLVIIHALQIAKMVLLLIMKKEISKLKKIKI